MSLHMSSGSDEFHDGNTFDGDSREATLSGSPIKANVVVNELFEEIDRYHNQEQAAPANLSNEIDTYREAKTSIMKPLNEPVVSTIHSWNTQSLKSKMTNAGLIIVQRRYKVPLNVCLHNPTTEM